MNQTTELLAILSEIRRIGREYGLEPHDRRFLAHVWIRMEDATLRLEAKKIFENTVRK